MKVVGQSSIIAKMVKGIMLMLVAVTYIAGGRGSDGCALAMAKKGKIIGIELERRNHEGRVDRKHRLLKEQTP